MKSQYLLLTHKSRKKSTTLISYLSIWAKIIDLILQQEIESSQAASYNGADDSHAESYAAASGVEDEEVEEEDVPPPVEEGYDNESFAEDIDSIRSVIENCLKFVCYMNLPLLKSL